MGCLRGRYRGTQECHKVASPKSSVVIRRAIQRPHGHRLRMTKRWEDHALIQIMRGNRFLSSLRVRVELIKLTGRRVSARMFQRRLIAAGYRSRRPARCPHGLMIIAADATDGHAGTGTGSTSTGLMWYLLMSPGSVFTTVMVVPQFVSMFVRD